MAYCLRCGRRFSVKPSREGAAKYCAFECFKKRFTLEQLFWKHAKKSKGCWHWNGSKLKFGYGRVKHFQKEYKAHRASWIIHFGKIPRGLCVLHKCDNPSCTNPKHLFLGTGLDNIQDRQRKNRQASGVRAGTITHPEKLRRGESHPFRKLTNNAVIKMRQIYMSGDMGFHKIAKLFFVSKPSAMAAIKGKTWAHV